MTTIEQAKRTIAAGSAEGMRLLGAGVYKPCYQGRYNIAAQAALSDPQAQFTPEERRLIASYIEGEGEPESRMSDRLQIRISPTERALLESAAEAAGTNVSEYVRRAALDKEREG